MCRKSPARSDPELEHPPVRGDDQQDHGTGEHRPYDDVPPDAGRDARSAVVRGPREVQEPHARHDGGEPQEAHADPAALHDHGVALVVQRQPGDGHEVPDEAPDSQDRERADPAEAAGDPGGEPVAHRESAHTSPSGDAA